MIRLASVSKGMTGRMQRNSGPPRGAESARSKFARILRLTRVLAVAQLRERYLGTGAGMIWAFLHPLILIGIFWVVFAQGFKMPTSGARPFFLVLICGIIPWMAFSDAVLGAAGAVVAKAYLVRKIAFPLEVLPFTQVVATFAVHIVLLIFAFLILLFYGRIPGASIFFLPVYMLGLFLLTAGFGLLMSALCVAFRDVQQGLGVVVNLLFWSTPIVWSADMLPPRYHWFLRWNPITYLIDGYRHAFLGDVVPIPNIEATIFFWMFAIFVFALGSWVFRRLKPGFADIL